MKKTVITRLSTLLLALVMLASCGLGVISVAAAEQEFAVTPVNNGVMALTMDTNDSIGQRFKVTQGFTAIAPQLADWDTPGNETLVVSLYAWDKTYDKTVAGEPIATQKFDVANNQLHWLELGAEAPAGEYLLLATEPTAEQQNFRGQYQVAWYGTNSGGANVTKGCTYFKGVETLSEMRFNIRFTAEVTDPFVNIISSVDVKAYPTATGQYVLQDYMQLAPMTDVIGQRVKVNAPVLGFSLVAATWGNPDVHMQFEAYKWEGSYDATVAKQPLATRLVEGVGDGSTNWLLFEDALPAGEYFFAARSVEGKNNASALYYNTSNEASLGYMYIDGAEIRNDLLLTVRFESALDDGAAYFSACKGYSATTSGKVTAPEQWKAPADSLINTHKVQPTTWVFTDGLGRESVQYGDEGVGEYDPEKVIAMFYWNWHGTDMFGATAYKFTTIQSVMDKYPEAKNDPNHPGWPKLGQNMYWNEPIYGFYSAEDPWVLRRHAEMLANASVDTIFFDNSNTISTIRDGYTVLYEAWTDAQEKGVNTPKISYHLPMSHSIAQKLRSFYNAEQLEIIYMDIYQRGRYQNLWFWFDGKPMVIGYANLFDTSDALMAEMQSFFTFRGGVTSYKDMELRPDANDRVGCWGWLSKYPQTTYHADSRDAKNDVVEQMSVGIAQNWNYKTNSLTAMNGEYVMGRSYTHDYEDRYDKEGAEASKWGYNFAEQWEYALEVDPKVVYVTGWNEWTFARKGTTNMGVANNLFDTFSDEFSRDIEPTKGALKDYYYYQLINYTRKFKGAEAMPVPSHKTTIDLAKGQDQWASVEPYYAAYIGNTDDRDYYGRSSLTTYQDFSGRNDIIGAQIARDDEYVYFNVECAEDITSYKDKLWMNLYIDVDQENQGWETFDFVVNKTAASAKTSVLEKFTKGYTSEKVADVEYKVDGRYMTVKIAKSDLGLKGDDFTINFAWTDNVHDADDTGVESRNGIVYSEFSGDILDFYTSGDVAPGARFKFSYISTADNAKLPEQGGSDESTSDTEPV
ncbi:MAG: hypothetical protein E7589_08450, partial [Ruminococcaceae bacterium]|nr:hypothetical protein [Oscillospiraceae bacterium]